MWGKNTFRYKVAEYIDFPVSVMVMKWLPDGLVYNVTFFLISTLRNTKFYTFVVEFLLSDNLRVYYVMNNVFRIKSGKKCSVVEF